MRPGFHGYALIVLLVLAVVPPAVFRQGPVGTEQAKTPAMSGHDPVRSSSHSLTNIRKLSGDFKLIVILAEFTDIKHKTSLDEIQRIFIEPLNKYWLEVTYGHLNVIGDAVEWVSLDHDEAYYGKDTDPKDPGSDQKSDELIADACRLAKNVDFTKYDDIMVVFAGHGQDSDSKNTKLLWPQAYRDGLDATCGGKIFSSGGYTAETTSSDVDAVGTFTHEFGHTIGLPDLYNTSPNAPDYWKTGVDYVGMWSLMGSGGWGGPDDDGTSPVGLESWSRIKLGWLQSVSVPLLPDGFVQPVNQLGDASGPRALKFRAAGDTYYLVEARAKTGVDRYLPDSGVLITFIDESKESGNGIVKVVDCHPGTKSINDAACKMNDSWSDSSNSIYMKVIGKQGTTFTVALASKPITTLNVYTAELRLANVPQSASANVTVDGVEYATIHGNEGLFLVFLVGSTHTVTLSQCAMLGEDTRFCSNDNTIIVANEGTYTVQYETKQYRLLVETQPSAIADFTEKWLTAGQTETVGPYDETVPIGPGIRYFLANLVVDGNPVEDKTVTLHMDKPHTIKVSYVTQYLLKVTSNFGDPKGEGWYAAGDIAKYSVTTPYGFLIQHHFVSWTGDVSSAQPQGTLTMTRPYEIRAQWRDDYTQLMVAMVLAVAAAIGLLVMRRRSAQKTTSTDSVSDMPTSPAPPAGSGGFCMNCGEPLSPGSNFCIRCGARQ